MTGPYDLHGRLHSLAMQLLSFCQATRHRQDLGWQTLGKERCLTYITYRRKKQAANVLCVWHTGGTLYYIAYQFMVSLDTCIEND